MPAISSNPNHDLELRPQPWLVLCTCSCPWNECPSAAAIRPGCWEGTHVQTGRKCGQCSINLAFRQQMRLPYHNMGICFKKDS